jgi:hypothetical protein
MVGGTAGKVGARSVSRFACAAGTRSIPVWFVPLGRHLGASVG